MDMTSSKAAARQISAAHIARYAAIGVVTKALTLPLVSYLPPAYAQATGLSLTTIGILFMVARLWDIVLDPIAGYCVDRFTPPFGPRKFWIAVAGCILFITIPPVFAPNWFGLGRDGNITGPAALLLIFYFGWTLMSVAHAAWPADLAATLADRARLISWREWAGVLGMLGIVSAPAMVEHLGHHHLTDQLAVMGGFAMISIPLALAAALRLPRTNAVKGRHGDPLAVIRLLGASARLRRLLAADLLSGSGFAVVSATSFFIFAGPLGVGGSFSTLMLLYFVGMIMGVPLFLRVTIVAGPQRSFRVAMLGAAVTTVALSLVPREGLLAVAVLQIVSGLFTGGYQSNLNALMVEVAEHHDQATGQSTLGSHFALLALTNKLGYALAIGICYPLLAHWGFRADGHPVVGSTLMLMLIGLAGPAALWTFGGTIFPHEQEAR